MVINLTKVLINELIYGWLKSNCLKTLDFLDFFGCSVLTCLLTWVWLSSGNLALLSSLSLLLFVGLIGRWLARFQNRFGVVTCFGIENLIPLNLPNFIILLLFLDLYLETEPKFSVVAKKLRDTLTMFWKSRCIPWVDDGSLDEGHFKNRKNIALHRGKRRLILK